MNSAVVYGTQSPSIPQNETSRFLCSSNTPSAKGKGKAHEHTHGEVDLEAQLDGASHSHHEHRTRRHHSHGTRPDENLIDEVDDQQEPFTGDVGNPIYRTRYSNYPQLHI